jgi:hypothetical protein
MIMKGKKKSFLIINKIDSKDQISIEISKMIMIWIEANKVEEMIEEVEIFLEEIQIFLEKDLMIKKDFIVKKIKTLMKFFINKNRNKDVAIEEVIKIKEINILMNIKEDP